MSELTERAAERRAAKQGTGRDLERLRSEQGRLQQEMREASQRRIASFIGLMVLNEVPTIAVYANRIQPGDRIHFRGQRTLGVEKIGNGWEVQPRIHDTSAEILQDGLFVFPNGNVARCFGVEETPAQGRHPITEVPHALAMSHMVEDGDFPYEPDTVFGTNEGLDILADAAQRYGLA